VIITVLMAGSSGARAQQGETKAIYTAGPLGAYQTVLCPPILSELERAGFRGYSCSPSRGSLDNISRVLANPQSVGFAQLDVFARWALDNSEAANALAVIRTPACEGLWILRKESDMSAVTFGQIVGDARAMQFAVADGGSRASFEYLQKIDPNGIGLARNIRVVEDATEVINQVASGRAGVVGFFVQFAQATNPNVKLLQERNLRTVPVVNRELVAAKVGDAPVYQVQTFNLTEGRFFTGGKRVTTACTPSVIVTGSAASVSGLNGADDHRAMIDKIKLVADAVFLPRVGQLAGLMAGAESVGGSVLNDMLAAYDAAKKKVEERVR
jgi:hypothetical protein